MQKEDAQSHLSRASIRERLNTVTASYDCLDSCEVVDEALVVVLHIAYITAQNAGGIRRR